MITLWQGLVPVDSLDIVQDRLARVVKRAEKKGFPVPTLVMGVTHRDHQTNGTFIEKVDISIEAEGPLKLGNWELVGVLSALADGSPFLTYAPGVERTDETFLVVNYCDHCQTTRQRRDTYVVRHLPDGPVKQVGSSCIKDFLGHDPSAITAYLDAISELDFTSETEQWGMAANRFYLPGTIISIAARIVGNAGYVNKAKAMAEDIPSTGELVRTWLSATAKIDREFSERYPLGDEVTALNEATIEYVVESRDLPARSEWEGDVVKLATSGGVQWRHVGIVASAVILGMRRQEKQATPAGESVFVGERDVRMNLEVTVTLKRLYEGQYGTSYIIRMTQFGTTNDLLWFGTGRASDEMQEGRTYRITATVKAHELDKRTERPTTLLTRVVFTR